jgi:hypothetical protein
MAERARWQYCQIEVGANNAGVLKQFFAGRDPVETDLHANWPSMLAKLGEQGWEMVAAFPSEGGRGRSPLTYVLKRTLSGGGAPPVSPSGGSTPPHEQGPPTDFEPLRGS